jgi:hypothetical protein
MAKARMFRMMPAGPSREVQSMLAETTARIRRGDVRAAAFVLVTPGGQVATVFAGHKDGHFHELNSGLAILRKRFDEAADA